MLSILLCVKVTNNLQVEKASGLLLVLPYSSYFQTLINLILFSFLKHFVNYVSQVYTFWVLLLPQWSLLFKLLQHFLILEWLRSQAAYLFYSLSKHTRQVISTILCFKYHILRKNIPMDIFILDFSLPSSIISNYLLNMPPG